MQFSHEILANLFCMTKDNKTEMISFLILQESGQMNIDNEITTDEYRMWPH